MNHLDLFTGIMGFSIAAHLAGIKTVAVSEIEPYCCELIKLRMPGVQNLGDIKNYEEWAIDEPIDIITASPPCQPFSVAGKQAGKSDDRNLWKETVGTAIKFNADWIIIENVVGIVKMVLDEWIDDLESVGYEVGTIDIQAACVGLPTVERHIWIIASSNGIRQKRGICKEIQRIGTQSWEFPRGDQGETQRWSIPESRVRRVGEGFSGEMDRVKALGNAIPPQIAYEIMSSIMEVNQ
jgi:DNA (cytosine-5)-methyltransferase 1